MVAECHDGPTVGRNRVVVEEAGDHLLHPRSVPGGKTEMEAEAKRRRRIGLPTAEEIRFNERTTAERVNGRIKLAFGGRTIRVRGHDKILCHLMFGVLALTIEQLIRFVT